MLFTSRYDKQVKKPRLEAKCERYLSNVILMGNQMVHE